MGIDRNEIIFAVGLHAVAVILDKHVGVGPGRCDLVGEIAEGAAHFGLGQIVGSRNVKPGLGQKIGHGVGVFRRIGQRGDLGVIRIADHQSELGPRLGRSARDSAN